MNSVAAYYQCLIQTLTVTCTQPPAIKLKKKKKINQEIINYYYLQVFIIAAFQKKSYLTVK